MRSPSRSFRSVLSLLPPLLMLPAACRDAGPELPLEAVSSPTFELTPSQKAGVASALEDASVRLLPALRDLDRTGRLAAALEDLSLALSTRDAVRLQQALRGTEAALAVLSGSGEEAAALAVELDAVRLLLLDAERITRPAPR